MVAREGVSMLNKILLFCVILLKRIALVFLPTRVANRFKVDPSMLDCQSLQELQNQCESLELN